MLTRAITSLQHPLVKHLAKLRTSRSYREEKRAVLVVGKKMVEELGCPISMLIAQEKTEIPKHLKASHTYTVTRALLKKITGVENPEPFAAEIPLPPPGDLSKKQLLLGLDGIADPGNLGTLLRTALALGFEGVFISESSCDPFNDKALRAAKGATFRLPIVVGSYDDLHLLIQKSRLHLYAGDPKGKPIENVKIALPLLLLLGSESHGVRFSPKQPHVSVAIGMQKGTESLNVAIAGALLMYEFKGSV